MVASANIATSEIAAIGITNQRETTVVWDRNTGKPIYNAIVWQDRRTASFCDELKTRGVDKMIQEKTGLVVDAYFSGTKVKWILDNVEGAREKAINGELCFGTIDTWLLWNLTNGKIHVTDVSNATRTMLCNIQTCNGMENWKKYLIYPEICCRRLRSSSEVYGHTQNILACIKYTDSRNCRRSAGSTCSGNCVHNRAW